MAAVFQSQKGSLHFLCYNIVVVFCYFLILLTYAHADAYSIQLALNATILRLITDTVPSFDG